MAQNARLDGAQIQAAFDFLPRDIRHSLRFGDAALAGRADFRSQSRLIDRQVAGFGSRIAAARLREVLMPAPHSETQSLSAQELTRQRDILREIGTAIFYFRDDDEPSQQATRSQTQRLHPRPLPARYYDVPQGPVDGELAPQLSDRATA